MVLGMEGERGRKRFAPPLYEGGNCEGSSLGPLKYIPWVGGSIKWGGPGFFLCRLRKLVYLLACQLSRGAPGSSGQRNCPGPHELFLFFF